MNILEAIQEAKKGKKIYRKRWGKKAEHTIYDNGQFFRVRPILGKISVIYFSVLDVITDDWEVKE